MTRWLPAVLVLFLIGAALPPGWPEPPQVTAEAYLLVDAVSGHPLAEKRADQRRPVASTVKILTALTALARTEPSTVVTVGDEVRGLEGASVGLEPGDRWTIEDLLEGVLVRSGNDAAVALAVHVGGSVEGFVELMEQDAAALGLDGVTIETPSGLEDSNLLSARDLAVLARAAMELPAFASIVSREEVELPGEPDAPTRNELLGNYAGADGIKTGYTAVSGWSVVASADRSGRSLIAVVLAADAPSSRFTDAAALLDHGFGSFRVVDVSEVIRLHVAGASHRLLVDAEQLTVPASAPTLGLDLRVPMTVSDAPQEVPVTWNGTPLDVATVEVMRAARPEARNAAAVARHVHDRVYAAMRAATAAGTWEGQG